MARQSKKSAMTTATLSHVAGLAGGSIVDALGRGGLWALDRFSRAPLETVAVAGLAVFSSLAMSNALFFQPHHHPAPLFGTSSAAQVAGTDGVPLERTEPLLIEPVQSLSGQPQAQTQTPAPTNSVTTTSSVQSVPNEPIGNREVFEVQRKLLALHLFEGTVDGYYGPKTAQAIKAFEQAHGLEPLGALTPAIVAAILAAPVDEAMADPVASTTAVAEVPPGLQPLPAALEGLSDPVAAIASVAGASAPVEAPPQTLALMPMTVQATTAPQTVETMPAPQPVTEITPAAVVNPAPQVLPTGVDQAMAQTMPNAVSTDANLVSTVQKGLASLGFLYGQVDGVAGEGTAKAIRNFEVYYNYQVTGQVTPELLRMLRQAGAEI
jgi:peptidoglycan hydrolase-like protein with peptidoglycan-binding domain